MKPSYEELEAKCAALAAENAGLKAAKEIIRHLNANREEANFCGIDDCYIDDAVAAMITPETDTFLAEVRAQGVESFAESQKEYVRKNRNELDSMTRAAYCGSAVDAERFAALLRKGVQS